MLAKEEVPDVDAELIAACHWHPQMETGLRCNLCNRFICFRCARKTDVGYRCPHCFRSLKGRFYNGRHIDYLIATLVTVPLSLFVAVLFALLSGIAFGLYLSFILAPAAATTLANAVYRSVGHRNARYLAQVVTGTFALVLVPFFLFSLLIVDWYGAGTILILLISGAGILMKKLSQTNS